MIYIFFCSRYPERSPSYPTTAYFPPANEDAPVNLTVSRRPQGWKLMSCCHCHELCQQVSWLLIGCTRVNNQSEARSVSWPILDNDYNSKISASVQRQRHSRHLQERYNETFQEVAVHAYWVGRQPGSLQGPHTRKVMGNFQEKVNFGQSNVKIFFPIF